MEKRDEIFGITTNDIVPYLGQIKWINSEKPISRYERYFSKALKQIDILTDTAILLTSLKTHPYSMAEIAQCEENIKGHTQIIYGIFVHEFSIGYLKSIYRLMLEFLPFIDEDMENLIIAYIQKVIFHELGHRAFWAGDPLDTLPILKEAKEEDSEFYAEEYAFLKLKEIYHGDFIKILWIFIYGVTQDYLRCEMTQ